MMKTAWKASSEAGSAREEVRGSVWASSKADVHTAGGMARKWPVKVLASFTGGSLRVMKLSEGGTCCWHVLRARRSTHGYHFWICVTFADHRRSIADLSVRVS